MVDFSLAPDPETGRHLVVHRVDCPDVRRQAEEGDEIATLFGCKSLPDDLPWHSCLDWLKQK
jgi:hypothetical protein